MVDGAGVASTARRAVPLLVASVALLVGVGLASSATPPVHRSTPGPADPVVDEPHLARVRDYLETERQDLGYPGMAAVLVHGGEAALEVGLGRSGEGGPPVTPQTPFLVASLAKSMTAVAVLQLVEDGAVALASPVTAYLPELAPGGDRVTVADLLHHRAGLSTWAGREPFTDASGLTLDRNAGRLAHLLRPAGFTYSNAGYDVLALLVERVSGKSFEEYLQAEVFGPLGMSQSTTDPGVARGAGLATGHHHWLLLGYRPQAPPLPAGMVGSYRVFSSAHDLGRFVAAQLQGGQGRAAQILTGASWRWLQAGEPTGQGHGYGGGLNVFPVDSSATADPLRQRVIVVHDGAALGYRAMMWMLPEEDLGFVLLANANDQTDEYQLVRVAYNVQRLLLDVPLAEREPEADLLRRWGRQALGVLALTQLALAGALVHPLRRRLAGERSTRRARTTLVVATAIDVSALLVGLFVVPTVSDAPLRVAVAAPDLRILMLVMALATLFGALRLALWTSAGRGRPVPSTQRAGTGTVDGRHSRLMSP